MITVYYPSWVDRYIVCTMVDTIYYKGANYVSAGARVCVFILKQNYKLMVNNFTTEIFITFQITLDIFLMHRVFTS